MLNSHADQKKKKSGSNQQTIQESHARALKYIKQQRSPQGWWPYKSGHEAATEATAWCALAGRDDAALVAPALDFFVSTQNDDGGWSTAPKAGHSDWTSGPALLSLRALQANADAQSSNYKAGQGAVEHALSYMFDSRTDFYGSVARLLLLIAKGKEGLEYARGWPWSVGCFHWVEPTSYALLALKCPARPPKEVYAAVITRANQFIVEHECKGGGWNHGSFLCLGNYLPPYIVTTAEALVALQEVPSAAPVKAGLEFLIKTEPRQCSAMEHAWAILALNAHGKDASNLLSSLSASQHDDGSFGPNIMVTALSTLALDTSNNKNPLKYTT